MKYLAIRILAVLSLISAVPAMAQDSAAVVIDLRPKEEREGSALTPLSGKCNQDVYRIADVASDPLKIEVLKQDLAPIDGIAGTITVLNWSIYYNKQIQQSGSLLESVGIQGYTVPGKKKEKRPGSKCSRKESAGGWYEGGEVTSVFFPLISEFEGTHGGKPVSVRVVYSPSRKMEGKFTGGPADTEALLEAIHQTAALLASEILAR